MRCTTLTLVALVACQDKKPEPPQPPPQQPHDGVTLVQPGTAPRQILRYHLTRGDKARSELVWDFTALNDGEPSPMPTLTVELETEVDDVRADGTAKLRITIVRTRVRDQAGSDPVRAEAAAMQGVVLTEMLAPDGRLSDSHVEAANLTDAIRARLDSLSRSLEQVAMQLPDEPVGVGATWRERKSLPAGGIRAISETIYTLTSVTPAAIGYSGVGLATGVPQIIEQDGVKVEVTNTHGRSETRGAVDLTRYAPQVTSTSSFTAAMNVVAPEHGPGSGPSTVEITMAIQVSPAEPNGAEAALPAAATGAAPLDAGPEPLDAGPSEFWAEPRNAEAPRSAQGAHSAP